MLSRFVNLLSEISKNYTEKIFWRKLKKTDFLILNGAISNSNEPLRSCCLRQYLNATRKGV